MFSCSETVIGWDVVVGVFVFAHTTCFTCLNRCKLQNDILNVAQLKTNHLSAHDNLALALCPPARYLAATGHSLATFFGEFNETKTTKVSLGLDEE